MPQTSTRTAIVINKSSSYIIVTVSRLVNRNLSISVSGEVFDKAGVSRFTPPERKTFSQYLYFNRKFKNCI